MVRITDAYNDSFDQIADPLHRALSEIEKTTGGRKYLIIREDKESGWQIETTSKWSSETGLKGIAKFFESMEKRLEEGVDREQFDQFKEDLQRLYNYEVANLNVVSNFLSKPYQKRIQAVNQHLKEANDSLQFSDKYQHALKEDEALEVRAEKRQELKKAVLPPTLDFLRGSVKELLSHTGDLDPSLQESIDHLDEHALRQLEDLLIKQGVKSRKKHGYVHIAKQIEHILHKKTAVEEIQGEKRVAFTNTPLVGQIKSLLAYKEGHEKEFFPTLGESLDPEISEKVDQLSEKQLRELRELLFRQGGEVKDSKAYHHLEHEIQTLLNQGRGHFKKG